MGAHYGSVQVRSEDRHKVKAAAEKVAEAMKIKMLIGPVLNGWIGIYPENNGQDERVGVELAKLLDGYVLQVLVHDDDIFAYWLHHDGELIDSYWSTPGYFGPKNRTAEQKMVGQPELFRPLIGDKINGLATMLDRSEPQPVFKSEKLDAFAKLLQISNALQAYEYIKDEDGEPVEAREQFEDIGSSGVHDESDQSESSPTDEEIHGEAALDPAGKCFLAGQLKILRDDLPGAVKDFDCAIALNPEFADAYNMRALAKQMCHDLDGALLDFERAFELNPDARYLSNRADIKRQKGDFLGALADYNQCIEVDYYEPMTLNNRGFTKIKLGDLAGAISDFDKAIELDPGTAAFYKNRGDVKRALKDFAGALADYNKTIEIAPDSVLAHNSRGLTKSAMGDLDEALADYDKAIELKPKPIDLTAIMKNRESVLRRKKES